MPSNGSIHKDAKYWVVRQHSGEMTAAERKEFESWLQADESHRHAYNRAVGFWRQFDEFKTVSFSARDQARRYRTSTLAHRPFVQFAFGLLLIVGAAAFVQSIRQEQSLQLYSTMKGEHRAFVLADGSQMELNTDSRVRIAYSNNARILYLDRGEALFTVARDDRRPFEVIAGPGRIVDLSTRFVVHRQSELVSVTVVEGAVTVTAGQNDPIRLARGDQTSYSWTGELGPVAQVDVEAELAWRDNRLVFAETHLVDVMAELASYYPISYSFSDARLAELKVSGSFTIGDLSSLLRTLEATLPVHIQNDGDRIRIDRSVTPPKDPHQG